jgi:hypothetical protein
MIHTIIIVALLYAAVRATLRGRRPKPDPTMGGRIVSRGPVTVTCTGLNMRAWRDAKHERSLAAKEPAPYDMLAAYRP